MDVKKSRLALNDYIKKCGKNGGKDSICWFHFLKKWFNMCSWQ